MHLYYPKSVVFICVLYKIKSKAYGLR